MSKYEQPTYQTIEKTSDYEIRDYDEFYTSRVKEQRSRGYSGFGKLFNYIAGQNDQARPIAMTVPVFTSSDEETMEFVIPKEVTTNIPKPTNPEVQIVHHPPQRYAVKAFRGASTPEKVERAKQELMTSIKNAGYQSAPNVYLAQYSGPYVPFFLRTNEILIELKKPA